MRCGTNGTVEVTGKPQEAEYVSNAGPTAIFRILFTRDLNDKAKESEFSEERKNVVCENAGKLLRTP